MDISLMIITPMPLQLSDNDIEFWINCKKSIISESGGNVSAINDISGNNRHATQVTGFNQPTINTRVLSGYPVLDFNGTSSFMTCPRAVQDDWTILVTCVVDNAGAAGQWFLGDGVFDAEIAGVVNDYGSSIGTGPSFNGGVGNSDTTVSTGAFSLSVPVLLCFTRNATTGLMSVSVNGGGRSTTIGPTGTKNASSTNNIGIIRNITSRCFDGTIAEIVVYSKVLSKAQESAYYNLYAKPEWGA